MSISKKVFEDVYFLSENNKDITESEVKAAIMTFTIDEEYTSDKKWMIYDISQSKSITPEAVLLLNKFKHLIKRAYATFAIVAKGDSYKTIIEQGLSESTFIFKSFEEFKANSNVDKSKATTEFLNTLLSSIIESTKISLNTEVKTNPCIKILSHQKTPSFQIGAIAGIVSNYFTGRLIICFSYENFYQTMSQFLSMDIEEIKNEPFQDIQDGAAELLNIFIGKAKAQLNKNYFNIQKVIPSVISGDNIKVNPPTDGALLMIPFDCEFAQFFILLTTENP